LNVVAFHAYIDGPSAAPPPPADGVSDVVSKATWDEEDTTGRKMKLALPTKPIHAGLSLEDLSHTTREPSPKGKPQYG